MSAKPKPSRDCVSRVLAYLSKATDAAERGETVADVDVRLRRSRRADDQRDVLLAMLSLAKLGEAATPQKIADVVDRNRGNVYKDLAGLVELGLVIRTTRRGAYSLTEQGHRDATDLAEQRSPATGNAETGKQQKPENGETPPLSPSPPGRGPG